jgi:hypothetical protein
MLEDLTLATFTPLVGETFEIDAGAGTLVPLTLIEARATAAEGDTRRLREPFTLLFRGPRAPVYAQQIVPLRNATLGALELFLVPLQPTAEGSLYEAVFG